jgi:hypothetical protein
VIWSSSVSRVRVLAEVRSYSRTSPAVTAVVQPVSVVVVAFCWLERVGGAEATMLVVVGNPAKVVWFR